jgi:hypothetical protein
VDEETVAHWSAATKVSTGERRREINKEYCSLYAWLILCHVEYERYIQLENIASQFLIFSCRHQLWRPDGAQVLHPGDLVDDEEWEADYYNPTQLNKLIRDRHVWSPREVQAAAQLLVEHLA